MRKMSILFDFQSAKITEPYQRELMGKTNN